MIGGTLRRLVGGLVFSLLAAVLLAVPPSYAAAPVFKAPFQCGEVWYAGTYPGHNANAVDFFMYQSGSNVGGGKPVLASAAGTVAYAGFDSTGGNFVRIAHGSSGWQTYYGHLEKYVVKTGASVSAGQVIGYVGDTGLATGKHLHYEQRSSSPVASAQPVAFDGKVIALGKNGGSPSNPTITSTNACPAAAPPYDQEYRTDVNGDGRADLIGFGDKATYVALGQKDGKFGSTITAHGDFDYEAGWRLDKHLRVLADVNGDGRADLVGFGNKGTFVALGQSNGKFGARITAHAGFDYEGGWRVGKHLRLLADVNGDGRADIVGFGNGATSVALGQSNGKFGSTIAAHSGFDYEAGWRVDKHPRFVADVNGDGRGDIVGFGGKNTAVALGQSNGKFGSTVTAHGGFDYEDGWRVNKNPRLVVDVNGDGRSDIVGFGNQQTSVALGQSNGKFGATIKGHGGFDYADGWRVDKHPRFLADVNGDGRDDVIGLGTNASSVVLGQKTGKFGTTIKAHEGFDYQGGWRVSKHARFVG